MNISGKTSKNSIWLQIIQTALLVSLITGCSSLDETATNMEPTAKEATDAATADAGATPEQQAANAQIAALEQQLSTLQVEWDQQKPSLERLVTNEADLQFLIQTLADMSQLADEPSREAYLGQDVLTPEKRQESLNALQSLVSSQEELATLLVDLSTVVSTIAANKANAQPAPQVATTETVVDSAAQSSAMEESPSQDSAYVAAIATPDGSSPVSQPQVTAVPATQASFRQTECDCSAQQSTAYEHSSSVTPAGQRDPAWFAMTTPLPEAQPAGGYSSGSQLDDVRATGGQPIPGLQVKTFQRRSLPSELAAAGADVAMYSTAPKFAMSRKSLTDYVSQLAFKLAGNRQLEGNKIGVASFVFFDDQLEQTSAVGNQLAEELSTVLPGYGARVIEYKLTKKITVGPTGDLSLSRDARKLRESQGMDYVLTGTMIPTRRGLQVNSRVVSTSSNQVIASASTLIPALVLQQL